MANWSNSFKSRFTDKAEREIEETFDLTRRAWRTLDLICAEFTSDPQSVACFDSRVVEEAIQIVKRRRQIKDMGNPFESGL